MMKVEKIMFLFLCSLFLLSASTAFSLEVLTHQRNRSEKIVAINGHCSDLYKKTERTSSSIPLKIVGLGGVLASAAIGGVVGGCVAGLVAPYALPIIIGGGIGATVSLAGSGAIVTSLFKHLSRRTHPRAVMTKNINMIDDPKIKAWIDQKDMNQGIDQGALNKFCMENRGMVFVEGDWSDEFDYFDRAFRPFEKALLKIAQSNEEVDCAFHEILKSRDQFKRNTIGYYLTQKEENASLRDFLKNKIEISQKSNKKCKINKKIKYLLHGFITENIYKDSLSVDLDGKIYSSVFYKNENGQFIKGKSYASMNDKGKFSHVEEHVTNLSAVKDDKGIPVIFRSGRSENASRIDELINFINQESVTEASEKNDKNTLILSMMDFSQIKSLADSERDYLKSMVKTVYEKTRSDRENAPLFLNTTFSSFANFHDMISGVNDLDKANLLGYYRLLKMLIGVSGKSSHIKEIQNKIGKLLEQTDILKMKKSALKNHLSYLDSVIGEELDGVQDEEVTKVFSALRRFISGRMDHQKMSPDEKFLDLHFVTTFLNKKGVRLPLTVQCKSGVDRTGTAVALSVASKDEKGEVLTAEDLIENPVAFENFRFRFEKTAKFLSLPVGAYTRGEAGLKWKSHPVPKRLLSTPDVTFEGKWTLDGKKRWLF